MFAKVMLWDKSAAAGVGADMRRFGKPDCSFHSRSSALGPFLPFRVALVRERNEAKAAVQSIRSIFADIFGSSADEAAHRKSPAYNGGVSSGRNAWKLLRGVLRRIYASCHAQSIESVRHNSGPPRRPQEGRVLHYLRPAAPGGNGASRAAATRAVAAAEPAPCTASARLSFELRQPCF